MSSNKDIWEHYGDSDPYFGVYTVSDMRAESLGDAGLQQFFDSGEEYVERIWSEIEQHFVSDFKPARSLDFGCGVARLTLPIAKRSAVTVGVDISSGMLKTATENAARFDIDNVSFVLADNKLSLVTGEFDFVHSFIVFQHINPKLGEKIFTRLVQMLADGGIGVLHVQYAASRSTFGERIRFWMYREVPFIYSLRTFLLRKKREPLISMYSYDLNKLLLTLQQNSSHKVEIRFSDHGVEGVILFFQKKKHHIY